MASEVIVFNGECIKNIKVRKNDKEWGVTTIATNKQGEVYKKTTYDFNLNIINYDIYNYATMDCMVYLYKINYGTPEYVNGSRVILNPPYNINNPDFKSITFSLNDNETYYLDIEVYSYAVNGFYNARPNIPPSQLETINFISGETSSLNFSYKDTGKEGVTNFSATIKVNKTNIKGGLSLFTE